MQVILKNVLHSKVQYRRSCFGIFERAEGIACPLDC